MSKRTWQDVMDHMTSREGEVRESTLDRTKVAFASKPFDIIRDKRLIDTVSTDFLRLLKEGGVSANVWLRVLHNTALKLDWLVRRVLAQAVWPKIKYGETRAITSDEHQKVLAVVICAMALWPLARLIGRMDKWKIAMSATGVSDF